MSDEWIVIPNWGRFQHYGKRAPLWIKVYTGLNSDPDWALLPPVLRGVLVTCWIEYARSGGQLHTKHIASMFGAGWKHSYLKSLNDAGFLQFVASKPARLTVDTRARETREEKEESKNPLTPTEWGTSSNDKPTNPRAAGTNPRAVAANDKEQAHRELITQAAHMAKTWNGKDSAQFDEALDALEAELQSRLSFGERDDLWEKAFHHGF